MKTITVTRFSILAGAAACVLACTALAQTITTPIVTIRATDPSATWQGDPGQFTIFREGPTNTGLNVFYRIGGTASNGVDYVSIGSNIIIPAGSRTNSIKILPINAGQTGTKTVELAITPSPLMQPGAGASYFIGNPSNAVVYISSNGTITNIPPSVRITSPANGSVYRAPISLSLFAYATDPDDAVASVEFDADGSSLGFGRVVPCYPPGAPICFTCTNRCPSNSFVITWTNVPLGDHLLTAIATDTRGAAATSAPVKISVLPSPPPDTNLPAIVSIAATDPIAIEGTNCYVWPVVTNIVLGSTIWATPTWTNDLFHLRTNCGPKNAMFTVRRIGQTNNALTVLYDVSGSATGGVDYVTLSGSVTIPAGQRTAQVVVVPIDDGPPDITSSVVLSLRTNGVVPVEYVLGYPRRAAAVILDGPLPRPISTVLADRTFHLNAAGPDGSWFRVEYSTDLANWIPLCTNQVLNGSVDFVDADAANDNARNYRAVPEAGPPAQ